MASIVAILLARAFLIASWFYFSAMEALLRKPIFHGDAAANPSFIRSQVARPIIKEDKNLAKSIHPS